MKIVLEKKDIRNIELEDFTFMSCGYYDGVIIFNVDDEYELLDEEDEIIIEISGIYQITSRYGPERGSFSGKLIIYKDDELFSELEEGKIFADFIELNCSVGSTFKVDTSSTLSENIHYLTSLEKETLGDNGDSVFNWEEFLDNEDLLNELEPEIKKIISDSEDDELKDELKDVDNIFDILDIEGFLSVEGIIDDDKKYPKFNEKYDNTLGKIMFPYFKKEFDDYVFEVESDGEYSISGEPGEKVMKGCTIINYAYIYLK